MSASELLNSFYDAVTETAELSSEYKVCPELDEVPVTVTKYDIKNGSKVGADGIERPWFMLILTYAVDSQEAKEFLSRDEVTVNGSPIFLTVEETGTINLERNQSLKRTLKVLDLVSDEPQSNKEIMDSFIGAYATGRVTHRAMTDKEGNALLSDEGEPRVQAEVSAIASA